MAPQVGVRGSGVLFFMILQFVHVIAQSANVSVATDAVKVQFFGEAECPDCRAFAGVVKKALAAFPENLLEISLTEFGNAYFATDACGHGPYSAAERHCFWKRCITASSKPPADCFEGATVYQHVPPRYPSPPDREGRLMIAMNCAEKFNVEGPSSRTAAHLFVCMSSELQDQYTSGADGGVAALVAACGEQGGAAGRALAGEVLSQKCLGLEATDKDQFLKMFRSAEVESARQTPEHAGVPYVLLNGEPMDDPMKLVGAVCKELGPERARSVAACHQEFLYVGFV